MSLESIRHLKHYAQNSMKAHTMDKVFEIANKIEREIAEKYMLLPVDADGVPIHVDDEMTDKDSIPYIVTSVSATRVYCKDGSWVEPSDSHHVNPDPVKELLEKLVRDVYGNYHLTAEQDKWIDECAKHIREAVVA